MKKIISAVVASVLCTGAFVSCGDKEKEKGSKDGTLSTKGKSEYVSIVPLDSNIKAFRDSIDKGIKYSIKQAKEFQEDTDAEYNPYVIKFSGDKFVMPAQMGVSGWNYYDGTFSVENGAIKFSYENYIGDDDKKINIHDEISYDEGILNGMSYKLYELSDEEKEEMIKKEQDKLDSALKIEHMEKLNKTGSYWRLVVPPMNSIDKFTSFTVLPFIRCTGTSIYTDCPNTLKTVDKFLCTDTYGIKLAGKYKKGKAFTLKYNLEDTVKDDEQSRYQIKEVEQSRYQIEENQEWLERAESFYHDLDSTIQFSDGEWEWYNTDDELLNNGKYEESKKYPGLIKMYVDEDSERCPDYADNTYPLWFYITDDGEIYYPAFVKVE